MYINIHKRDIVIRLSNELHKPRYTLALCEAKIVFYNNFDRYYDYRNTVS